MADTGAPRSPLPSARELALGAIAALERRPYAVLCGTFGVGFVLAAGLPPSWIAFAARTAGGAMVTRLVEGALAPGDVPGAGARSLAGPGGEA